MSLTVEARGMRASDRRAAVVDGPQRDELVEQPAVRLLIVSCHTLFAQSLQHSLGGHRFNSVEVADAGDANQVLATADAWMPDIVLLDLDRRQGGKAVPIIEGLAERGVMIIGLVPTRDRFFLAESLEAGITSFFDKTRPLEELVELLSGAADGVACQQHSDRAELIRLLTDHRAATRARSEPFEHLTPRESQVLTLLIAGKSAEEIAALRVVALTTVRTQIRGILGKLRVNSQLAAVALARESGWDGGRNEIDLRPAERDGAGRSSEQRKTSGITGE